MLKNKSSFSIFAGFTLAVAGGLFFNLGGLAAGSAATFLQSLSSYIPWIFLIYPLLLTVRGDINGVLTGKLGTALHLGTLKPTWRNNTNRFVHLMLLILILTIYDSVLISIVTSILGFLLKLNLLPIDVLKIFAITLTTFTLTAVISLSITFVLTFFIYRKNGDPDVLAYPITSSINDILITLIFVAVCWLYRPWNPVVKLHYYLGIPTVIFVIALFVFLIIRFRKEEYIRKGIVQTLPVLTITSLIAAGTGSVLASFPDIINSVPVLIVFYPAIISIVGSQSSILAKLSINFFGIITAALIVVTVMSLLGTAMFPKGMTIGLYGSILGLLLLTNFLSFLLVGLIALSATFITFRLGLDPDNLVNPLLSSSADLITTTILILFFILLF
ncbi:MAG: magnesium transporter [Candidatus Heimdallarchaeaceae archaeon]